MFHCTLSIMHVQLNFRIFFQDLQLSFLLVFFWVLLLIFAITFLTWQFRQFLCLRLLLQDVQLS